jgi:pimeloyl-ACP methyl ester carboxylesterase
MERTCRATNQNIHLWLEAFLLQWFHRDGTVENPRVLPPLKRISMSSLSSSPEGSDQEEDATTDWTMEGLYKDDTDMFLSWAFFGKHYKDLTRMEHLELDKIYMLLNERYNLVFCKGKSATLTPRLLTLEDVFPIHRPLIVYLVVSLLRRMAGFVLRICGFRRFVTSTNLVYWYRGCANPTRLPLLFFHGIAPGGLTFYLPMVFYSFGIDERPCFLFENQTISCSIGFDAVSEDDTVKGVFQSLETHGLEKSNVSLCGHSFGSCPITWLLHSKLKPRIRQLFFLDPVTILLSEPDVMNSFLYSHQLQPDENESIMQSVSRAKIRILASSELFTEYFLRRHLSWFNSELWLDEIPENVQVAVCVAKNDEILNASKVQQEVFMHNEFGDSAQVKLVYWEGAGHARCITSLPKWREIRNIMLEQEAEIKKVKSM